MISDRVLVSTTLPSHQYLLAIKLSSCLGRGFRLSEAKLDHSFTLSFL